MKGNKATCSMLVKIIAIYRVEDDMFNTDKPIEKSAEDKLGRGTFAKQLANAIVAFQPKDNYAISLQGKWGCGKTSVLNMAIEEIKRLSEDKEEKNKIIIIQFNPWNFTDTGQLITQFFVTLTNALNISNPNQNIKDIGAMMEKYSAALKYAEYIPIGGSSFKFLPDFLSKSGKVLKKDAEEKLNDVSYRKCEVEKALMKLDSRILVVIDDIDRLPNEQIRLIFQLVNAIAGFPNVTYLLSFDKDIVSRALGDVQGCKGQEYLEKIIQVPFDVPQLNISKLYNILFAKLDALIELPVGVEFDKSRWSTVFNECISPFIFTLRDVNRYCNVLSFTYAAVKEEADFIDMAGLCALKVFAPSIFEWIRGNKAFLVGGYTGGRILQNDLNKRKEEALQNFKDIYPESPNIMINAVASLFPAFSNSINYYGEFTSPSTLHQAMRVASESKFNLYFSLSLDELKISRKEMDNALLNMGEEELQSYIKSLSEREFFRDYVEEVRHNLSRIPEDRIELTVNSLIFQSGRIEIEDGGFLKLRTTDVSVYTISDLLFRINDEDTRYRTIANMFLNADFKAFQFLLYLLHIIELSHGRIAETSSMYDDKKLVRLENLHKLEYVFLERTKFFLSKTALLDWDESRRASMLWYFIEEETYNDYMKDVLADDFSVPKYISMKAGVWVGGNDSRRYEFNDNDYMSFLDEATIINAINKTRVTYKFWTQDSKIIEASAAFILHTEQNHESDISSINELIERWKKEYVEQEI